MVEWSHATILFMASPIVHKFRFCELWNYFEGRYYPQLKSGAKPACSTNTARFPGPEANMS